jgi:hypothetical protein
MARSLVRQKIRKSPVSQTAKRLAGVSGGERPLPAGQSTEIRFEPVSGGAFFSAPRRSLSRSALESRTSSFSYFLTADQIANPMIIRLAIQIAAKPSELTESSLCPVEGDAFPFIHPGFG